MVICLLIKERYGKYTEVDPCSLKRCPTKFTSGPDEITTTDVHMLEQMQTYRSLVLGIMVPSSLIRSLILNLLLLSTKRKVKWIC